MNADGWVVIDAKVNTEQLEKDLKDAEKQLEHFEKDTQKLTEKKVKLEAEIELKGKDFERKIEEIRKQAKVSIESYSGGDTFSRAGRARQINAQADFDVEAATMRYNQYLEQADKTLSDIEEKLQQNEKLQENINEDIAKMNSKLADTKATDNLGSNLESIKTSVDGLGQSFSGIIRKVARWGLAVFGVRSAYMFIRQEMSALSNYDKQIGADIEYMRFAITTALQPVIEKIIELAHKLLVYIAYIAKAWFGVNIFANATTKAFEKANKGVKATNKSAKELQKTITGFDEMNILNKDGSVGAGGGGGGITAPSVDLSNWDNVEIPGWIQWIADNKELILGFFLQLVEIFATIKIAAFVLEITHMTGALTTLSGLAFWGALAGVVVTLIGIYNTVCNIVDWIADPTWENFADIIQSLGIAMIGLGTALLFLNASNPVGWILIAIGAIAELVVWFLKFIGVLDDEEDQLEDTKNATERLIDAKKELANSTREYSNAIKGAQDAQRKLSDLEKKHKIIGKDLYDEVLRGNLTYDDMTQAQKEVYLAYVENEEAQIKLTEAQNKFNQSQKDVVRTSIESHSEMAKTQEDYKQVGDEMINAYEKGQISATNFFTMFPGLWAKMDDDSRIYFAEKLPNEISKFLNVDQYKGEAAKFTKFFNDTFNKLNTSFKVTATYSAKGTSNKGFAKGGIAYFGSLASLPKLASGGVINQPGRGVPIASAIGGERGMEGVIPLTDSQQMALLGEAIGKYITVNLTNVNQMNGRVISRELKTIENESVFASNS